MAGNFQYYWQILRLRATTTWARLRNWILGKPSIEPIPEGMYCYVFDGRSGTDESGRSWLGVKTCPYYRWGPGMEAGCTFLGWSGWDPCLGDQCKVCGIKDQIPEEDSSQT